MKKLKSLKLMLLAVVALCSSNAFADDTSAGGFNITYAGTNATITSLSIDNAVEGGTLVIPDELTNTSSQTFKVVGVAADAFTGGNITKAQKDAITAVTIADANVATIGANAFKGLTNLTTVTIGKKVTTIGESAFEGCSKLLTVNFPTDGIVSQIGVNAFKGTIIENLNLTNTKLVTIKNLFGSTFAYAATTYNVAEARAHNDALAGALDATPLTKATANAYNAVKVPNCVAVDANAKFSAAELTLYNPDACTSGGTFGAAGNVSVDEYNRIVKPETPAVAGTISADQATDYAAIVKALDADSKKTADNVYSYNIVIAATAKRIDDVLDQADYEAYNDALPEAVTNGEQRSAAVPVTPNDKLLTVTLPATWQNLGEGDQENTPGAFENCTKLATVNFILTDKVTPATQNIKPKAFLGTALTSLNLTNTNVVSIPEDILVDYDKAITTTVTANNTLTEFVASAKLTTIEEKAFNTCVVLETVTFPVGSALTTIGNYAFGTTPKLTTIDLGNCKKMASLAASTPFIPSAGKTNNVLETLVLPNGDSENDGEVNFTAIGTALAGLKALHNLSNYSKVTTIGAGAFAGDAALESLTFNNKVTSIEATAFNGCTKLAELTIDGKTNVTGELFDDAAKGALTSLTISGDVTGNINGAAFANCTAITTLSIASGKEYKPGTVNSGAFKVADGAIITIGKVSANASGLISALGNVTKLTLGEIDFDFSTTGTAIVTTLAGKKIAAVEVGKITKAIRPDIFGQTAKITFAEIAAQVKATSTANPELKEIVFAGKIANTAGIINALTFDQNKAENLETVSYEPTSNIPTVKVFDAAAFGTAAKNASPEVEFNTVTEIGELYQWSVAQLYRMKFDAQLKQYPIELAAPAGSAYNYGKHYETVATKISKSQNGESVIVYGAYVDSKDKNIYLEQLHIIEGYYWIPANVPVIVKSANNTEVIAEKQGGHNSMNFVSGGANYVSEIAYLESNCIGQQLMDKTDDIKWSDPNRTATVDNTGYDLYAMAKTSTYGMKWKMFGSATNLKTGLFYVRCAKGGAPAPELNVIWTDGSEESNTTGIENVNVAKHQFDGEIFNLQGIRVSEPVKGQIYIQNGKKFMMK